VGVFADGYVVASPNDPDATVITVAAGKIDLGGPYALIRVGLPYLGDFETLDIDTPGGSTLKESKQNVTRVGVFLNASRGVWSGQDFPTGTDATENLRQLKMRQNESPSDPINPLTGYVYVDTATSDIGGYVEQAKSAIDERLTLPPGYTLQWTGQYEFMAEMEARMRIVLPLTLVLIVALLYLAMRGWPQTFLVLLSLPFAVAGSVWLLAALKYNLSTAVWVGLIAVGGVAAETGIVMIVYLDEAFQRYQREGRIRAPEDVDVAVIEGASARVRPLVMTVLTTVLGLLPLLWESGVGADVSARTAAPVVGGLWSCMFLTLLVLPAAYTIWRRGQIRRALQASPFVEGTTEP